MKKKLLIGMALLFSMLFFSQKKDSIAPAKKVLSYFAERFPVTRVINVEYNQVTPYNYTSKLSDKDLPEGKVNNLYQLKASANIHFIKKPKWMLGTTLSYKYTSMNINKSDMLSGSSGSENINFGYHTEALNLSYFSKLFKKNVIYSGSFIVDGSDHKFERIHGIISGNMVLKATPETKMTLGLIAFLDPSSVFFIAPSFTYRHQFANGLIADVLLPKGSYLRKEVFSQNGRVSLGSELDNTFFYLYNFNNSDKTYNFSQLEINSGLTYEHTLGRFFIATLKTGIKSIPIARVFEKNKKMRDYIFDAKPKASFYFNIGISFNPFAKAINKRL